MALHLDPNNLTAGDVVRVVGPLALGLATLFLVGYFASDFVWLVILAFVVIFVVGWARIPREDKISMVKKELELEQKIDNIPIVGRPARYLWKILSWVAGFIGIFYLVLLVVSTIGK